MGFFSFTKKKIFRKMSNNTDISSLISAMKTDFRNNKKILEDIDKKDTVVFLGNTGSGKSTLINFLAFGTEKMLREENGDLILKGNDERAMGIGTGGKSETIFPKSINIDNLELFDLPGLNDTEGSTRNLVGAAFIRKILISAKSVKIVIVVSHEEVVASRGDQFSSILKAVKNLFKIPESESQIILKKYSLFVLTKSILPEINLVKDDLLKKSNDTNKKILQIWLENGNFAFMCHSFAQGNNLNSEKTNIFDKIKNMDSCCFQGNNSNNIDVSSLYPPNTTMELEKLFSHELEKTYLNKIGKISLKEIKEAINLAKPLLQQSNSNWTESRSNLNPLRINFWKEIESDALQIEEIKFLEEFCKKPFEDAIKKLKEEKYNDLNERYKNLEKRLRDEANKILNEFSSSFEADTPQEVDPNFYRQLRNNLFEEIKKTNNIQEQEEIILTDEYKKFIEVKKIEKVAKYEEAIEAAQEFALKVPKFNNNKGFGGFF